MPCNLYSFVLCYFLNRGLLCSMMLHFCILYVPIVLRVRIKDDDEYVTDKGSVKVRFENSDSGKKYKTAYIPTRKGNKPGLKVCLEGTTMCHYRICRLRIITE